MIIHGEIVKLNTYKNIQIALIQSAQCFYVDVCFKRSLVNFINRALELSDREERAAMAKNHPAKKMSKCSSYLHIKSSINQGKCHYSMAH